MKKFLFFFLAGIFLDGYSQTSVKALIQNYLNANTSGQEQFVATDWKIESTGFSKTTGIENYYVKQLFYGVEVEGTTTNILVKNDKVLSSEFRFESNLQGRIRAREPRLKASEVLPAVLREFNLTISDYNWVEDNDSIRGFRSQSHKDNPITVKKAYVVLSDRSVRLTWNFYFYTPDFQHLWNVYVDADNGEVLQKFDGVLQCHFPKSKISQYPELNFSERIFRNRLTIANSPSGSYRVFPYDVESPNHGSRELITTAGDVTASPYGWHDTDGRAGAEYTITRGNNIWAKEDIDGDNAGGISPDGGSALIFDFPYEGTHTPSGTYTSAATTNLFYMGNVLHDFFYQYGFDEANGNFQQNNYGKGGRSNDVVLAESQDGSATNNANFSTPSDGQSPRMQLFLWNNPPLKNLITVSNPDTIAGAYSAADNNFVNGHVSLPQAPNGITAALVLFDDGITDTSDACTPALNPAQISGRIALIRRGDCPFTEKVLAAQNAGAVAVVIVNTSDAKIVMGGDNAAITIPAVSVSKTVGDIFVSALNSGDVTLSLSDYPVSYVNADSDFDNGVIAHEYTHGVSTRLTGGANSGNCLKGSEQMGEGWSDFVALMLQLKPTDAGHLKKGIATFLNGETVEGFGIRAYPYSTDMTVNPLTFGATNGMTFQEDGETKINVHAVGTVWASMLWDLAWAYITEYGFDADVYRGTGGNNKVMQLVIDAMKIQPCNPTFVKARNAILLADRHTTGGANNCMIWEVFARRGLGVNASSGSNTGIAGINDQVEDFTAPSPESNCDMFKNGPAVSVYPNPANDLVKIAVNDYEGPITFTIFDIHGRLVKALHDPNFKHESQILVSKLQAGIYVLKIEGNNLRANRKMIKH